jgi:hypothetical protein
MDVIAALRLLILSAGAGIMLLASAAAQVGGSTPVVNQPKDLYSFEHYIHVVPKTPADYRPITAERQWAQRA